MIKTLTTSLRIDISYAVNSFIYTLRKLPIFCDLFTDDIYKSKLLKRIISILSIILSFGRMIVFRLIYFYIIYVICHTISKGFEGICFVHIFFVFSLLGLFINNKLLNTSTKKYFCIVLFNMDANKYMKSNLWFNIILSLILNILGFIFINVWFVSIPIISCVLLCICSLFTRIVGEGWNVEYYLKNGYLWINNTIYYFIVCGMFLIISILPYNGFYLDYGLICICDIVLFLISLLSLKYLYSIKNYKVIYKRLNTATRVMNGEESNSYNRQAMVEVKNKDKVIKSSKLKNKKGYDLFNTIFFERHKEILTRSSIKFSIILGIVYCVFIFLILNGNINHNINNFLLERLGWYVLIMFFINRGAVITQAMFFNCDHAMLTYNFYREPNVIISLFKKRLFMVSKINILPSIVISIGNCLLLYLSGGASIITYISIIIFIMCLSVFFSIHYLVIYYLLQPYNKDMKIRKFSYTIVCLLTYLVSYMFTSFRLDSVIFSIFTLIFTVLYIIVGCLLVNKFSPRTFRINL